MRNLHSQLVLESSKRAAGSLPGNDLGHRGGQGIQRSKKYRNKRDPCQTPQSKTGAKQPSGLHSIHSDTRQRFLGRSNPLGCSRKLLLVPTLSQVLFYNIVKILARQHMPGLPVCLSSLVFLVYSDYCLSLSSVM